MISQLGNRLESTLQADDVAGTVAATARSGLNARWVRVVLDRPTRRLIASAGPSSATAEPTLTVPLIHHQQAVGALECGPKVEGRYRTADIQLLETLGRQAALAISNSQLSSELTERLHELAASRARLVHAEESGRRRLERDIHDGVQQELVAVLARLGLARNQMRRSSAEAYSTLGEAQTAGQPALESLQDIVRGIHPPVLTDRGLLEAVQERALRLPITVEISADGLTSHRRYPRDIEGAAYFLVAETLANILKHADASHARVCFAATEDGLTVQVHDNGRGFNPQKVQRNGLRGLNDRVDALVRRA